MKKTEEGYFYTCRIPENTTATLVSTNMTKVLGSGKYSFLL